MTNEEMAVLAKAGYRDYIPKLWEGVRRFVHDRAYKWSVAVGAAGGVTTHDLEQAGFLAMMSAVDRFDPTAGYAFMTILGYSLKAVFSQTAGVRTKLQREDPLRSAVSLDIPTNEGEDSDTLGDFLEDPHAVQDFKEVEDKQLHKAVEKALQQLTEAQRAVIRYRYYRDLTLAQTARELGISTSDASQLEAKALRTLRHPRISRELRTFL